MLGILADAIEKIAGRWQSITDQLNLPSSRASSLATILSAMLSSSRMRARRRSDRSSARPGSCATIRRWPTGVDREVVRLGADARWLAKGKDPYGCLETQRHLWCGARRHGARCEPCPPQRDGGTGSRTRLDRPVNNFKATAVKSGIVTALCLLRDRNTVRVRVCPQQIQIE